MRDEAAGSWARARALFDAAIELPGGERADFLARECGGDAKLRAGVEALLQADALDGGVLDGSGSGAIDALLADAPGDGMQPGARIGAWRLVCELGRGGMGVVWLAERADEAYEQQVALKLIRGTVVSGLMESRFLRERRILARLQHPGIARLVDGGFTAEGQPWLAMERVEGEPLTDWAAKRQASLRDRLRLFLEVCDAVEYAHRQLVVHCDLKPANILVTGEGRVRLLDFGVARLQGDTDETPGLTRAGVLLLTPEYAAPEQVRGEAPSTATDVYGLGAVLYELLSGRRLRELRSAAVADLLDAVDRDAPPLANPALPRRERRRLGGDLQTIVHRAIAHDRERRYGSVDALAGDLRRYLDHRPVLARPDSAAYRLRKYARRHRVGVVAGAALGALLALGVAGTLWQAAEARREADRAQAMSAFLRELFAAVDPEVARGREVSARDLLDIGAARIGALRADPEVRTDALVTLGELYFALGLFDRAEALYRAAERETVAAFGEDDARTTRVRDALAYLFTDRNRYGEAEALLERSVAAHRAGGDPEALANSLDALAHLRFVQGRLEESRELRRELLALNTRVHGARSWQAAASMVGLAANELQFHNHDEAGRLLTDALALQRELLGSDHPSIANTLGQLGSLELGRGRPAAAEPYQRESLAIRQRVFGPAHPDVALSLDQIALTLQRLDRLPEAVELYEQALALRRQAFGERHSQVADTLTNLATADFRAGHLDAAIERQREALDIYVEMQGERHPRVANAMSNLGVMLRENGRFDDARAALERSLELRLELLDPGQVETGVSLLHLSILDRKTGRLAEADRRGREALAIFAARLPADHPRIAEAHANLAAIGQAGADAAAASADRTQQ